MLKEGLGPLNEYLLKTNKAWSSHSYIIHR